MRNYDYRMMGIMLLVLAVASVSLLAVGCTSNKALSKPTITESAGAQANSTNQSAATTGTCNQYCEGQPHAQCTGTWSISGAYPSCTCNFECSQDQGANESNGTGAQQENQAGSTQGASGNGNNGTNSTGATNTPATEGNNLTATQSTKTIKSIATLMSDALDELATDFYRTNGGVYEESRYTWQRHDAASDPREISFEKVLKPVFNETTIETIEAAGYVSFEKSDHTKGPVYGTAVFDGNSTPLDGYTDRGRFTVSYPISVGIEKRPYDCYLHKIEHYTTAGNASLVLYQYKCRGMVEIKED